MRVRIGAALQQMILARFPGGHTLTELDHLRSDRRREFHHRLTTHRSIFLRQKSASDIALEIDAAFVRRFMPEDQFEESRLSGAVRTDQSVTFATVHLKRHITKQGSIRIRLGKI